MIEEPLTCFIPDSPPHPQISVYMRVNILNENISVPAFHLVSYDIPLTTKPNPTTPGFWEGQASSKKTNRGVHYAGFPHPIICKIQKRKK